MRGLCEGSWFELMLMWRASACWVDHILSSLLCEAPLYFFSPTHWPPLKNSTCQIELPAGFTMGVDSIVQDFKETTSQWDYWCVYWTTTIAYKLCSQSHSPADWLSLTHSNYIRFVSYLYNFSITLSGNFKPVIVLHYSSTCLFTIVILSFKFHLLSWIHVSLYQMLNYAIYCIYTYKCVTLYQIRYCLSSLTFRWLAILLTFRWLAIQYAYSIDKY